MQPRTLECVVKQTGDAETGLVYTVLCHGSLVAGTSKVLREAVKPLFTEGARIVVDMSGVLYVDSMGLGAMVGLKASANAAGHAHSSVQFTHLSDRVKELIRYTHLGEILNS